MTTMAPSRPSIPPHDHTPSPYTGPSRQEVLAMRRQYCHPSTFLYYREPLMVVEGHMQYLYDETGRRYLDFIAGIVTVSCGHSHPKFLQRLQVQLALIQHTTTIYLHRKFPAQVGGGIHHAINPDPYRSPFRGTPEEIASRSAADIRDLVRYSTPGRVAAFIAEPIQGVGGTTFGAPNYLREAYAITREYGGLCIADEVQTGFGRTGDHFWGFEASGVVPDIVTMAKGIGNGMPLAAVTTRREIAESLTQRIHFNTFGGNPISMAAGLAVLDIIEEDGLQENARVTGARLKTGLAELMTRHRLIGDVRGRGLMLGVELVLDRETKEPATRETLAIWEAAREMGLLIGKGGLDGNVLRIKPPMCINAADVDFALEVLDEALTRVER